MIYYKNGKKKDFSSVEARYVPRALSTPRHSPHHYNNIQWLLLEIY
jgi:hypothetical protein